MTALPRQFFSSLYELFATTWRHRELMRQLVRREVIGRYRGSWLGILWSLITPVLMLAVYTFVFGVVFRARWNATGPAPAEGDKIEFALILFAGLILFNLFSECVMRAPGLILGNVNYVKKVIFPLEILPWVSLGSALFHAAVSLAVLLAGLLLAGHSISWAVLLLPLVLLPFLLLTMGLCWFLAATGVFVRDIGQLVGMLVTVLMFLSPIFYPASALPEQIRGWLFLNPITFVVEQARGMLIWGHMPNWSGLGAYALVAILAAWVGFFWFQKTRKGFADVL